MTGIIQRPGETGARPQHNLPVPLTPLIGRAAELRLLVERVADPGMRLITITGVGGVGKTRLVIEVGRELALRAEPRPSFAHGVFLIGIATLGAHENQSDALIAAVAGAIGLVLSGPDPAVLQVANFLAEKQLLLILDGFEQLLPSAPLLAQVLEIAPQLTILVTTRMALGLRGEWVLALEGLPVPPTGSEGGPEALGYPAVALFCEAAQTNTSDPQLGTEQIAAISQICRMVDGLPLGIELAAGWARFLEIPEIAGEIAQSIDFLSQAGSEGGGRHQSMRAIFSSSWDLLTTPEQEAFRRLAIFRASFTRGAAATVADTTLPTLASLVSKSLVRRTPASVGAETRFTIPESLRQYAAHELERAGELKLYADRHAAYFLRELAAQTSLLQGPAQPTALAALSADISQIRAAWSHAVARRDAALLGQAAQALFHIYNMRSWFAEGAEAFGSARAAIEEAALEDEAVHHVRGDLMAREGWFYFQLGRHQSGYGLLKQSVAILRQGAPVTSLVWALSYLGAVSIYLGDISATVKLCRESLELAEAHGDTYGQVIALSIQSQAAYENGSYDEAQVTGERSLALERQIGSPWSLAYSLLNLGKVAASLGDHQRALRLFQQSLEIRDAQGDQRGAAICLSRLGEVCIRMGDRAAALQHYRESLGRFRQIGNHWGVASALINLGRLALDQRADRSAACLLGEALTLAIQIGITPQITAASAALTHLSTRVGAARSPSTLAAGHSTQRAIDENQLLIGWAHAYAMMSIDAAIDQLGEPAAQPAPPSAAPAQPADPVGLTSREIEVLRLVAIGLTDAQVADRLIISRRTVNAHLSSVYSKIGVNTRTAAARFATEHGLV